MAQFQIAFPNGPVQASNASGPLLNGGVSNPDNVRAYRAMDALQLGTVREVVRPARFRFFGRSKGFFRFFLFRFEPELRFADLSITMRTPPTPPFSLIEGGASAYPANAEQRSVYDGTLRLSWQGLNGGPGGFTDLPARLTSRFPFAVAAAIAGSIEARIPTALLPGAVGSFSGSYSSQSPIRFEDPSPFSVQGFTLIGSW